MNETIKLTAFLCAYQLDIRGIKSVLTMKPASDSSSELFFELAPKKHQYYFNYGVIVFSRHSEEEMNAAIKSIAQFQKNPLTNWMRDEFEIEVKPGSDLQFEFDHVVSGTVDAKVIRIAMFNLAQSVAIDFYQTTAYRLLMEVRSFTTELETSGRLRISRKNMLKFIGKSLNTQNDIAENIYIFDAPDIVWDDYLLDKLHQGLIRHFDLRMRFSELEYALRIIEDNLKVFREIYHQRESSLLEIIIIILILVEVFDLFISKLVR